MRRDHIARRRYAIQLMEPDPSVLRAIEDASARDPGNMALRIHYSQLLRDAGRFTDCLGQVEQVLNVVPDSLPALLLAGQVGTALGDPRAPGWTRLYESLSGIANTGGLNSEQSPPPATRDEAVSASDDGPSSGNRTGISFCAKCSTTQTHGAE